MDDLKKAIELAKQGNEIGFNAIYEATRRSARAVIRRYADDDRDYEDILQEVYIKVYQSIGSLEDSDKLQAWVNRIAANTAIRHNMKKKPKLFSEMENDEGQMPEFEDENVSVNPELIADKKAVSEIVLEIMNDIPEDQRDALWMVYGQKIKIKDMAESLGVSENTIKSRLFQGKKKLLERKDRFKALGIDLRLIPVAAIIGFAFEETTYAATCVALTGSTATAVTAAHAASVSGASGAASVSASTAATSAAASTAMAAGTGSTAAASTSASLGASEAGSAGAAGASASSAATAASSAAAGAAAAGTAGASVATGVASAAVPIGVKIGAAVMAGVIAVGGGAAAALHFAGNADNTAIESTEQYVQEEIAGTEAADSDIIYTDDELMSAWYQEESSHLSDWESIGEVLYNYEAKNYGDITSILTKPQADWDDSDKEEIADFLLFMFRWGMINTTYNIDDESFFKPEADQIAMDYFGVDFDAIYPYCGADDEYSKVRVENNNYVTGGVELTDYSIVYPYFDLEEAYADNGELVLHGNCGNISDGESNLVYGTVESSVNEYGYTVYKERNFTGDLRLRYNPDGIYSKFVLSGSNFDIDQSVLEQPADIYGETGSWFGDADRLTGVTPMTVVNCNVSVSLRAEPDTSSQAYTQVPLGDEVLAIEPVNDINGFYYVDYMGRYGYILKQYLSGGSADADTSSGSEAYSGSDSTDASDDDVFISPTQRISAQVVNCDSYITLREEPDTSANALMQIPLGEYVDYYGSDSNGFALVYYMGEIGYVLEEYLEIIG